MMNQPQYTQSQQPQLQQPPIDGFNAVDYLWEQIQPSHVGLQNGQIPSKAQVLDSLHTYDLAEFLHKYPTFIKHIFEKLVAVSKKQMELESYVSGKSIKELADAKTSLKSPIVQQDADLKALYEEAIPRLEAFYDAGKAIYENRNPETGDHIPITDQIELEGEHFIQLLISQFHQMMQQDHETLISSTNGYIGTHNQTGQIATLSQRGVNVYNGYSEGPGGQQIPNTTFYPAQGNVYDPRYTQMGYPPPPYQGMVDPQQPQHSALGAVARLGAGLIKKTIL